MPDQRRRALITATVAGLGLTLLSPAAAEAQDINGRYQVSGRNPDGSTYSGTAEVSEVFGKVTIRWRVAGSAFEGIGSREDRVVTVDWGDTYPVIYVVMPDGSMHGTWANGQALDRLTR